MLIEDFDNKPWDPWCTYVTKKVVSCYNPNNVRRITQGIIDFYTPEGGDCVICPLPQYLEGKKEEREICYKNGHPCPYTARKDYPGSKYYIVETRISQNNPVTILMRRGLLFWNFDRKCPFIFRTNKKNGLSLHHKDENPYNDDPRNTACVDSHMKVHQSRKRLTRMLRDSEKLVGEAPNQEVINIAIKQQQSIQAMLKQVENIEDSPKVAEIIKYVTKILEERGLLL